MVLDRNQEQFRHTVLGLLWIFGIAALSIWMIAHGTPDYAVNNMTAFDLGFLQTMEIMIISMIVILGVQYKRDRRAFFTEQKRLVRMFCTPLAGFFVNALCVLFSH